MTVTEQIIPQIDAVVQNIISCNGAVQAENQRTSKAKADAAARYNAQKSKQKQQSNNHIQGLRANLRSGTSALKAARQNISAFEYDLSRLVPRNRVGKIPPVNGSFNAQDARELLSRIRERGFWAWLKKVLALGKYDSDVNMAAELYGKIDSAYHYYDSSIAAEEKKYQGEIQNSERAAKKKLDAIEAQYRQDLQNEDSVHAAKMRALAQQEQKLLADPRFAAIQKQLGSAVDLLGAAPGGWKTYTPAKDVPEDLLLGVILYPCKINAPSPNAQRLLKKLSVYEPSVNGFTLPLTVPMNKPTLLYTECEAGDVKLAAGIYQSIIARMIRFMPPRACRAVFFDPVNRSTSLGQLIHLSGDGTSQICSYHLSPQDINTHMNQLTEHVDKVCRSLTGAGCADINAYNRIPKIARIPYTAVVIHDYPHGFDSTSLGYLEVLINKAEQCGISILISHKQGDKIEHKAQEVLNLINRTFRKIKITTRGKASATITMGANTYAYRPSLVQFAPGYLDEINKRFTYKAPIENSFAKFFGGRRPEFRSAKKGLDIPFAVDANGAVVDLQIGYDLSAYGFISGGVGSGKTTLLHMLITSAMIHYEPAELEMWLIDYKEAEFAFYMRNPPPHVRYVVADKSSEISYSILDEIVAEIQRRNDAFVAAGVKDYVEYRESAYGRARNIPRLLIVIDEFHRMAQAAQNESEYKTTLENIFAEARSAGVTLLLCDQQISNGLAGLSQKSRDLISVRIALRNKVDEIRETLAVENAQLTESVKKMILDTSSGVKGSAIYKYEVENKTDEFANKVMFRTCRSIYASPNDRTGVVAAVTKRFPAFDRDKTFFVGAARQRMDIPQIKAYEKRAPQRPDMGERFYIGTPLGIQPCFYFNLKPAESGENILLAGNNHEKRIAILKAVLSCAGRYGYTVRVLAAKASQLYRQNKDFFQSIPAAEVMTSFPEICKYIGERANQLKSFYSDDDEDFEFESGGTKELVIFIGLDELYAQMEASPYNQKTAWNVQPPPAQETASPSSGKASAGASSGGTAPAPPSGRPSPQPEETPDPEDDTDKALADNLSNIEKMLAGLGLADSGGDDGSSSGASEETSTIPDKFAASPATGIKGYHAVGDLAFFFSDGWKLGINSMVVVDRGTVFAKMRQIKLDGIFNHRIALVMSPDEAQGFMAKTRIMKTLIDTNDSISAVYEYLGGREQCFRPYRFD